MATRDIFTTITTEGALLPPDLLQRITESDADLEGLRPSDYFLLTGERLNEAISHAWTRLLGAWVAFRNDRERLAEDDSGTALTRSKWLLPLFHVLEYGQLEYVASLAVDGRDYAISHRSPDGRVPLHLMGCNVPIDRRTPGLPGAATASPHSTLQVFLNRSEDHLWGIVSNGLRLRLLRDNVSLTRQAYIEFDIEAMMEGEVYADFVLLYLLLHKSRFAADRPAEFWIERWRQVAIEQGTRALDQLRDQVERAIAHLGAGFIVHPHNAELRAKLAAGELNKQDYYRQLLRLVYRMLFLFTAEDRDLLRDPAAPDAAYAIYRENYSTRRLRRLAENFRGTRHHDAYEGLRIVMRLLGGEPISPHPPTPSPSGRRREAPLERYREMVSQAMVDAARELRQRQTPAEERLWACLRDRRLGGIKFRRQHPIANSHYVVDFFSYEMGLIVELDGPIHQQQAELDAQRQTDLEELGYTILRFTNDHVFDDLASVLSTILSISPLSEGVRATPERDDVGADAYLLGLPVLDGFLFRDEAVPDIIDAHINNVDLLEAVRALAFIEDRQVKALRPVDYKNLGPEELGSVYESLLELHPELNLDARTFNLTTAAGHERKTTGSYYTPDSLVQELLNSALEPVIQEALTPGPSPSGREEKTAEERLLDLKVCDPATGSGHFLIAAAHRMARALAQVRTYEEEPPPDAIQAALRDVIGRCIYGVDINPMAVELCKVSLWMEALEPGKPLTFLDHRIKVGNSLLGTTPRLMANGIPVDAFPTKSGLLEGDDYGVVSDLRQKNREELDHLRSPEEYGLQLSLFAESSLATGHERLATGMREIDAIADDTPGGVQAQANAYRQLQESYEYQRQRFLADLWCAAFVWRKTPDNALPPTSLVYDRLVRADDLWAFPGVDAMAEEVHYLAGRYQFFHWHIEFPDVFDVPEDVTDAENEQTGWNGGFDCVLGNPPWDQIQLDEREFFASVVPEIAEAPNMAARNRLLKELKQNDPYSYNLYLDAAREVDGIKFFCHASELFPYTSYGRLNTAPLFAERTSQLASFRGLIGLIIPTGIATDSFTQYFFQDVTQSGRLRKLYDFENRAGLFPHVHRGAKFCIFVLGPVQQNTNIDFMFYALSVSDLSDQDKAFSLKASELALINPNTNTCPVFQHKHDAEIITYIYHHVPVLENESHSSNPWNVRLVLMYMMNAASDLFLMYDDLANKDLELDGNRFVSNGSVKYLPLYEGKMVTFYDHRAADIVISESASVRQGQSEYLTEEMHKQPRRLAIPRYWIEIDEFLEDQTSYPFGWLLGFKDVTSVTNERTVIASYLPFTPVGHTLPLVFFNIADHSVPQSGAFLANLNSFCLDYIARQKVGGLHLTFTYVKQFPILPPDSYTPETLDFISQRVLELSYTAWDLESFAQDIGWDGPPFVWDEARRFLLRCELDALYFHLYQIARDDVDYIMGTFPIVKRKDEESHGHYRTKDTILEMYDEMAVLPRISVSHPKGLNEDYLVPDVSQFETWLNPGPADPRVAH